MERATPARVFTHYFVMTKVEWRSFIIVEGEPLFSAHLRDEG